MKHPLILGGAGFIGTNVAEHLLQEGQSVTLFDNLSRAGVETNLARLKKQHGSRLNFVLGDIRDRSALRGVVESASQVFHFAAQVAVTTSLSNPMEDFEINAAGTLNVLEEIRRQSEPPPIFFTSTNKVYGGLEDVPTRQVGERYEPVEEGVLRRGIGEDRPLDFHSPYGCSKGTADQYVLDYARSYGLPAVVFRMSCIYGPHQFGTEDQGWVAHFLIRALNQRPITLYGDGMQVRDILYVKDLVEAMMLAMGNLERTSGRAFNMGGGPVNTISLLELVEFIRCLNGRTPELSFSAWRTGDQRYYVSDTRKFSESLGWKPKVGAFDGIELLHEWLIENRRPAIGSPAPGATLR